MGKSTAALGLLLALAVLGADQASKYWVLKNMMILHPINIFPGLNFNLTFNPGIAFGLFAKGYTWVPVALKAVIGVVCLGLWIAVLRSERLVTALGLGALLGGALGNLIDRIYYGLVVDFIDIYIGQWHWYTFNLADAAIVLGVGLLLLTTFFGDKQRL